MKKFINILLLAGLLFISIACGSSIEVQNKTDQDFVRTQIAATLLAEYQATKTPIPVPTSAPVPVIGTRSNPVLKGQFLDLVYNETAFFKMVVLEIIRGEPAMQLIINRFEYNQKPLEGREYVLAKIGVDYLSSTTPDQLLEISQFKFTSVSNNQIIDYPSILLPKPEFNIQVYPGAHAEGYIAVEVFKDDPAPLIIFSELLDENKFFFSIQ